MDPILFSVVLYRSWKGIEDVDIHNLVVYYLDSLLYRGLLRKLRRMDAPRYVVKLYETVYDVMSIADVMNWLRGREIGIDSIPSFVYAIVVWRLSEAF